ncbi:MAG TPA: hypothetical protein VN436_05385 [Holophaga sp.]|nr:hypothetical protein [Holophaga sp.]
MTTLHHARVRCAVCSAETEYPRIGSTNSFGSLDLDTRPPEMQRSTMFAWVQRCPSCGYCAPDVSSAKPQAAALVRSPDYARQLVDTAYPALANSFLCKALLDRHAGDFAGAAWSLIHAAWACDDAGRDAQAKACRGDAADMIQRALDHDQKIADQDGAETAIQVDLLRRAGRLEEARQMVQVRRRTIQEGIILKILAFQETLISRRDQACHRISEGLPSVVAEG